MSNMLPRLKYIALPYHLYLSIVKEMYIKVVSINTYDQKCFASREVTKRYKESDVMV